MTGLARFGVDLSAIGRPLTEGDYSALDVCGGALLLLSREEAELMHRNGHQFEASIRDTIPDTGRRQIRLRCRDRAILKVARSEEVRDESGAVIRRTSHLVKMALCGACEGQEMAIRMRLRKLASKNDSGGDR